MTENGTDWRLVAAEEARQRNKAEEALVEMRRFLFDYFHLLGPDPLENINVVVRTLGKVLGSDVALYNRLENGILKTWSIDNEPPGFKREDHPQGHICYDMTISHHGPTNIEAVVLNDLEGSEWETLDSNVRQYGLKSYLGFPVLVEGQVVGSLCVVDTRKRRYTDVEQYIIAAFSSAIRLEEERLLTQNRLAAAIADLKEKNEQIERMALTDSLTDLPNRRAMIRFLDREIATLRRRLHANGNQAGGKGFAVVLCDIDRFKAVNDTHGHACGDEVAQIRGNDPPQQPARPGPGGPLGRRGIPPAAQEHGCGRGGGGGRTHPAHHRRHALCLRRRDLPGHPDLWHQLLERSAHDHRLLCRLLGPGPVRGQGRGPQPGGGPAGADPVFVIADAVGIVHPPPVAVHDASG